MNQEKEDSQSKSAEDAKKTDAYTADDPSANEEEIVDNENDDEGVEETTAATQTKTASQTQVINFNFFLYFL